MHGRRHLALVLTLMAAIGLVCGGRAGAEGQSPLGAFLDGYIKGRELRLREETLRLQRDALEQQRRLLKQQLPGQDTAPTYGQPMQTLPSLTAKQLMGDVLFEKCGLAKLTREELVELDRWLVAFAAAATQATAPRGGYTLEAMNTLEGGIVIAADGKMLGRITKDRLDATSLANRFGDYGNKFSPGSLLNRFGDYGSEYSATSPWCRYTTTPPQIVLKQKVVAYLTVNEALTPRVDPRLLLAWLETER